MWHMQQKFEISLLKLGIFALFIGLAGCLTSFLWDLIVLLKWSSFGKFTDAASDAVEKAAARICWGKSRVFSARFLFELLIRTTSQFIWEGKWVWSFYVITIIIINCICCEMTCFAKWICMIFWIDFTRSVFLLYEKYIVEKRV